MIGTQHSRNLFNSHTLWCTSNIENLGMRYYNVFLQSFIININGFIFVTVFVPNQHWSFLMVHSFSENSVISLFGDALLV